MVDVPDTDKMIYDTFESFMALYTVKYITNKGNIELGIAYAPKVKNSKYIAAKEFCQNRFNCKKVIGITPIYTTDKNYPYFQKIEIIKEV